MEQRGGLGCIVSTVLAAVLVPSAAGQAPCPEWSVGFGLPGTDGSVHAFASWDDGQGPAFYAGGDFEAAIDVAARGIVRWDGQNWGPLAGGPGFDVLALERGPGGAALCAGGGLSQAGGYEAGRVSSWDGSSWTALGGDLAGPVRPRAHALVVFDDGSGPALYAGGNFTHVGGQALGGIARWDGAAWVPVGGGTDGSVHALAVHDDGSGPALYAAGNFAHAGGLLVNHVARWNGSSWSALGAGLTVVHADYAVRSLCVFDGGGGASLYAGGTFSAGSAIQNVARWDGSAWSQVGGSLSGDVRVLEAFDSGGGATLYAAGAGIVPGARVARLEPQGWAATGPAMGGNYPLVHSLGACPAAVGGTALLWIGGSFSASLSAPARNLVAWDGAAAHGFGLDQEGLDEGANALAIYNEGSGTRLYAGGAFLHAGPDPAMRMARWDGASWGEVPGAAGALRTTFVSDLVTHAGPGGIPAGLYVSGYSEAFRFDGQGFVDIGPVPGTWDSGVADLELFDDGTGTRLFAAGDLGTPLGNYGLVGWDGTSWTPPGGGIGGYVAVMAAADLGGAPGLYAGGAFGWTGGGVAARNVACWDGQTWTPLGTGLEQEGYPAVKAMTVYDDGSGPKLVVGGEFLLAGGVPVQHIAAWDGQAWSALGTGLSGGSWPRVTALCTYDDGAVHWLVASGEFSDAGGVAVANIARWDGQSWHALGAGLGGGARRMLAHDDGSGPALWAVGGFPTAGTSAAWHVARWSDPCACTSATYCTAKVNSQGCVPAIGWSGKPSASAPTPFFIEATLVISNKSGLFFYGRSGPAAIPFQGGTLCVAPPVRRTPAQSSGGNPPPEDCSGSFALDFNAVIQAGSDPGLVPGAQVFGQYWYRDPASPSGTGLSDSISFSICP